MLALHRTVSLRYLRLRWSRAVLIMVSIALGVAAWVGTGATYENLEYSIRLAANPFAGLADLHISNGSVGVPRSLEPVLAGVPGVRAVHPLLIEQVQVVLADHRRQPALLLGLDLTKQAQSSGTFSSIKVSESAPREYLTALLFGQKPALTGAGLEPLLPQDSRTFQILAAGTTHELTRVGVVEASGPAATLGGNVLIMDCDLAARLLEQPGQVSRLDVALEPDADRQQVMAQIQDALKGLSASVRPEHLALLAVTPHASFPGNLPWPALLASQQKSQPQVRTPETDDQRIREVLAGLRTAFLICGAGALVVGMFLVYNALSVSVTERRHDIGVLRSLGATRDQVRSLFFGEALLLGVIGSLAGIPFGLALSRLASGPLRQLVSDILVPLPAREVSLRELLPVVVSALVAGVATTLAASLLPAIQAAREEPADVLRRVPPSPGLSLRLLQLTGSLLLGGTGVVLVAFKDYLPHRVGSFTGIGFLFLGTFLAIALLSALMARLLQPIALRLLPIEGRLAADNLVRAPGRTGLVIAALAACVALLVQTAGVIRSNEQAILSWLKHTVTADLIITAGGPVSTSGQSTPMKDSLGQLVEQEFPGAQVVPISFRYLDWPQGQAQTLVLLEAFDARVYHAANLQRGAAVPGLDLYRRLSEEPGTVLVSENFALLHHVRVDDFITLPGLDTAHRLRIIGTVEDYSFPRGVIFLHRDHYLRDFNIRLVDIFDVYLPHPEKTEEARKTLQQSPLAAEHALFTLTGEELRDYTSGLIHRLYSLAYSQQIVVGLVATLGVITALLISVLQRRRELGLLRAVGATRAQVLCSVLAEALLMGLIGSVLGILFGLVLEWYAVRVLLLEECGYRFPLSLPWWEAGLIALLAVTAATLAGLLPALQALRLRIAEAINYE